MKKIHLVFGILFLSVSGLFSQTFYGTPPTSKISTALNRAQVTHKLNIWQLDEVKSDNKFVVYFDAIEYTSLNSQEVLKGIKITLKADNGDVDNNVAKSAKLFEAYIDQQDYADVLVVVNQLLTDLSKREKTESKGACSYITKGNVKLGFNYTQVNELAYISFLYSQAEIMAEFSNIEKFFTQFRSYIEIASKELYLPQNSEKLKNVKKSNQEAKDVIIDDI